ncbi:unnamed protein product [Lactuca virosa]|uniref:DUF4378 domain-containing protein n=1 Tax=Lactuca virosa TaxID=75947 RepID=A0AAU9MHK5_9ASTR|nr:unnamed protein product [Lactuca virosa]
MSAKGMYTLREDKQELTKQLGCMNGIFQLFDRRYLLGQKKLPQGGKKEINNASEKPKEKMANEKHRASTESSRNSVSSSSSSLDCSKRLQTEPSSICPSIISEPLPPTVTKDDIKNVVKDSMTRKPRVVSVKTVAKDERKGPIMTHIDSPRPVLYERKDQNLDKLKEISRGVKEISRFSCDGRESIYKLKSVANIKEIPRLSLDSKQSSIKNYKNTHEVLVTNKRPSSSVVARLMGLEALNDVINGGESLKTKPCLDDTNTSVSHSRLSSNKMAMTSPRIQLEPAPWGTQKQVAHKKASRVDHGCHSVYGQIQKRMNEVEFKSSGKDLRALKQILEAIQRTNMKLEKTEDKKIVPQDSMVITSLQKVKKVNRIDNRRCVKNLTPIETKAKKPVSPSRSSGNVRPRLQRSKNGIEKQPVRGNRKQSKGQLSNFSSHVSSLSQQSDTVSFPSESDTSVASQNESEVTSNDSSQGNKNKFGERLIEYKTMAEQPSPVSVLDAFYTEETMSPMKKKSYRFKDDEDLHFDEQEWSQVGIDNLVELNQSPSGVKMENINHLVRQIELLNSTSDEVTMNPHENGDKKYIKEILLASGFFKNLDCATTIVHLYPTGNLINPELFNILEKTRNTHESKSSKFEKMRRNMIFDSVNDVLVQILRKKKGRIPNGEKILMELWSEINNLQSNKRSEQYDEVLNIIAMDVNNKSEDWDDNCNEVPNLALDIERLIFKDLISEIVNFEVAGLQDGPGKHCRKLFIM